jgi:Ca-activated chloride channel family protein
VRLTGAPNLSLEPTSYAPESMPVTPQTCDPLISRRAVLAGGAVFILFLITALHPLPVKAQEDKSQDAAEVIKVYSNLVSVPVIVSDRDGRYISGLQQQDFKLYDNGAEQKLAYFDAAEAPLNVALLLDTSRSTESVIDDIRQAAKNFLKELRPQDRAMIVSFDYGVHKLSPLTSDRKILERAIKEAQVGEFFGTLLNDALLDVIAQDLRPVNGRKAIVLLTDGEDAGSRVSSSDVLSYATESDAMIYSIYYAPAPLRALRSDRPFPRRGGIFGRRGAMRDQFPQDRFPRPRRDRQDRQDRRERRGEFAIEFLTRLSQVSAGHFYASEQTDLKKTFILIADELRNQYRLGFYPDALARDGSLHKLRVKVDKPEVAVRARTQYRAAGPDR